jgi:uncharacterized protein (DUF924 family)
MNEGEAVLAFWFGVPGEPGHGEPRETWFRRSDSFDAEIRARFAALHTRAARGLLDDWMIEPETALALVIVLDQFSRNLFRDSPRAFENDARALDFARQAVTLGHDGAYAPVPRLFFYLPFEHSEALADQERAVALIAAMEDHPGKERSLEFAVRHRDVIARFGRFPHRNAVLGRQSTDDEIAFLRENERGF